MDLDAVLARKPAVALVDELAHTNVPGSGRHEKRWQDVLELIEAGISVITTVNIQHLESLADAVERISGIAVRERVPDWVVRSADQIELVDSSPEQLRRRMLHGNIYPPDKVPQALTHFFKTENLVALRELALRFLADETDEALLEYLRRHDITQIWETTERILVCVTGAPGTDALLRRAARLAARLKTELHVVHVTGDAAVTLGEQRGDRRPAQAFRRPRGPVGHARRGRPGRSHRRVRPKAPDHPDRPRIIEAEPLAGDDARGDRETGAPQRIRSRDRCSRDCPARGSRNSGGRRRSRRSVARVCSVRAVNPRRTHTAGTATGRGQVDNGTEVPAQGALDGLDMDIDIYGFWAECRRDQPVIEVGR